MTPPVLEISNLETFYGPVMALRGVSLQVRKGQIVAILGANGAGKSTLLRTVSGVMEPRKGEIMLEGEAIHGLEPDAVVRAGIAHVPEGREVFPFLTVTENLAMGSFSRRDPGGTRRDLEAVYDYFPALGERRGQPAGTLSGGQQQMLAIGRGLMARPKIMLLDEPSLGLSPILIGEIFSIITRLNKEMGVTMVLVEQNAGAALKVAGHGYVLEIGRIVMDGEVDRLLESEDIREFYLGMGGETQRGRKRWKRRKTWR